jgi:ApaG protein
MNTDQRYNIKVSVRSSYLDEQSDPQDNRYVFAYTVTIENDGNLPAKLLSRHWVITDSDNQIQEVRGEGVVGEQPRLSPGERFEYTSGTVIGTPVGTMSGSYRMVADDGTTFDAEIPRFTLSIPRTLH